MMQNNIRPMQQCDVAQVAELEKLCFADPWTEEILSNELQNPISLWLVATDGERVLGYVGSQSVIDESDMMNIAVHPDCRKHGIAEALLHDLQARLRENGMLKLTLEVRVSNEAAIALYHKHGYVQIGRRPNYYVHPKEDALILQKNLEDEK